MAAQDKLMLLILLVASTVEAVTINAPAVGKLPSLNLAKVKHAQSRGRTQDSVVAAMEARALATLRQNAAKAAKYLEDQSQVLGSPALGALAARVGRITSLPNETGKLFKETKSLLTKLSRSGSKHKSESLQDFCTDEVKKTDERFAVLQGQAKQEEADLRSMAAKADKLSKEISSLKKLIGQTQKTMDKDSKQRERAHAQFLKELEEIKKKELQLNSTAAKKITINNAPAEAKLRNELSEILMRRMDSQTHEALEISKFAKEQRDISETFTSKSESSKAKAKNLKRVKTLLIEKAHGLQKAQGDMKTLLGYKQTIDEKCKGANVSHARPEDEVKTVVAALAMMSAH